MTRPTLAFDESFRTRLAYHQYYHTKDPNTNDRLILNVFKVLCFHQGPLREVSLSNSCLRDYPAEVDQILLFLVGKCIQSLCIKIDGYKVSSCLFSFTKLKMLQLSGCVFTSPHISFEEFGLLTQLHLTSVKFQNVDGVSLVIKCSSLEVFNLIDSGRSSYNVAISIEAPNLWHFGLVGIFRSSIQVNLAPLLVSVSLAPYTRFADNPTTTDVIKFLDGCPILSQLSTTIDLIKDFVMITHTMSDFLLPYSTYPPGLQELVITVRADQNLEGSVDIIEKEYEDLKQKAKRPLTVKLQQLFGTKFKMSFIRWLLATSPRLDKMTVEFSKKISTS